MAHEVESMAYARAVPWHGLGAQVSADVTAEEMLEAAGLNWRVKMCPMTAEFEGEHVKVPGRFALIRDKDKKVMTVASEAWTPVQNSDILSFFKNYVEAGGARLETAGSLRGGARVWALASLDHSFEARPGDKVKGYLLLTGSHVVGCATTASTTQVRVVCANTLRMAESNQQLHYKQNHLREFDFSAAKAHIESAHEELVTAEKIAKQLVSLKLSVYDALEKAILPVFAPNVDMDLEAITKAVNEPALLPRTISEIMDSYYNAPGADPDTGWGAMNAVTHWTDHICGRDSSTRLFRSWIGDNSKNKLAVQDKLLELV